MPLCLVCIRCAQAVVVPDNAVIAVPVLVEDKSGQIDFDLSESDFSLKDNGVEQQISLQANTDVQPLSLLIVIQTGNRAGSRLDALAGLGELLANILTNPTDQAAVLTFDSRPHLIQGFTADSGMISRSLASIAPGDSGASLLNALHLGVSLLDRMPSANRRAVLLISGRNVSFYGLSFSSPRKGMLDVLPLINPAAAITSEMQRNIPKALAELTGGDSYRFDSQNNFESHINQIANDIHNVYILNFHPQDPRPGFHSIEIAVRLRKTSVAAARSGYWVSSANGTAQ